MPPRWPDVAIRQFPFGQGKVNFELHQEPERLTADLTTRGTSPLVLEYSPALPSGARVDSVMENGRTVPFRTEDNGSDVHVHVRLTSVTRAHIAVGCQCGVVGDGPGRPNL